NAPRNPCLRVWPENDWISLIQISLGNNASFFLQNDALIAILIVTGREVVISKAREELYHVVGLEKTRNRKTTRKKAKEKNGFWFPTFHCFSGQTLKQGSNRFTIGQTRVSGFGLKCTGQNDALIAILIVTGREVVISKAREELYHV